MRPPRFLSIAVVAIVLAACSATPGSSIVRPDGHEPAEHRAIAVCCRGLADPRSDPGPA